MSTAAACVSPGSMTEPGNCVTTPVLHTSSPGPIVHVSAPLAHVVSHAPLPFTGADVQELAVIGLGAVLAGGLLLIRRRRHATV
jgi:LPXTG-motif cell wall-anchored protein